MYTMKLSSRGNPDFGQYAPLSEPETVTGETLADIVKAAERYCGFWNLGGGNWTTPAVKRDGKVIGYISYNGRVWESKAMDAKEIVIG